MPTTHPRKPLPATHSATAVQPTQLPANSLYQGPLHTRSTIMKANIASIVLVSLVLSAAAAKPAPKPPVLKVPVCSFNSTTGLYTYETPAYNGWANGLNANGQSCTVSGAGLPAVPAVAQLCSAVPDLDAATCTCTNGMVGRNCDCDTWTWTGDAATSCQMNTPASTIPGRKMLRA